MIQHWSGQAPEGRWPSAYGTEARVVLAVLSVERIMPDDQARQTADRLVSRMYAISRLQMCFTRATVVRQRQISRLRGPRLTELLVEAPVLLPSFEPGS